MYKRRFHFKFRYLLLAVLSLAIALILPLYSPTYLPIRTSVLIPPALSLSPSEVCFHHCPVYEAHAKITIPADSEARPNPQAEQSARAAYEAGQFQNAVELFEQAIAHYATQNDFLRQAMAWGNLALAQQQLGNWEEANGAIATSLALLEEVEDGRDRRSIQAQVFTIAGQLHLEQGQAEQALHDWEQAAELYVDLEDRASQWQNQIYQARALQGLGFYRQAIDLLEGVNQSLQNEPDSAMKLGGLQELGDALQTAGDLARSRQILEQGVAIARTLDMPDRIADLTLSLANTLQALGETDAALALYQELTVPSAARLNAQLNLLNLLVQQESWNEAQALALQLDEPIRALPSGRTHIYTRIKYAETLLLLANHAPEVRTVASSRAMGEGLAIAIQQAHELGDRRTESYALGSLGRLYERTHQYADAVTVTYQALNLAQTTHADDLAYRWHWQLGRVLREQGQRDESIAAYQRAIATLQSIRTDLVAMNPEVQFTFQQNIEPIHRELMSLLMRGGPSGEPSPEELESTRQVIESLQQAELENFFREACLDAQPVAIEQIDSQAAVFYPVILPDRLEVIVHLPDRPLQHHTVSVTPDQVTETVLELRRRLVNRIGNPTQTLPLVQQVYDWLIRPSAVELQESEVKTLVFVLDGPLRNLPMAVLHDGDRFLIEQYSVALTPGLQLLTPRPLNTQQISVIAAGLTESRQGFSPLPGVGNELTRIAQQLPSQTLLNQDFTRDTLQQAIATNSAPVVHLATHGQFSSSVDETFILSWSDRITINQLRSLLQGTELNRQSPIELLVMSACQTASGDQRAVLGLAGIAVRAGARSTLASLWSVDDQATSELMEHFYHELAKSDVTKAEALRRAQVAILQNPVYGQRAYYWAAFVLLGNWL
ncbi:MULTISPECIES: CHAT domain-containing protein [unclassified Leptolyngbya]|uniref:CHAT domain-containing protein n=1 Tax=unclassified Leptolyngbya TaxID=2650499 RepID=UPI001681F30D|nr:MULTISPECIES: CHAT domain-containing protein [unclassified Leptolyngbya]MBD1909145.1 CHAT domain-containing protein [Leptolyngbya sp. FACHB-8]MBD2157519.1 CHAT domain-containing protein [Leptolyngbya sp. FACHB-16]